MKGALIHGVLLVAMLALAYQTWTRDTTVKATTGTVVVWNEKPSALQAIVYETKDKTIRIDAKDGYWWGTETKTTKKAKKYEYSVPRSALIYVKVGDKVRLTLSVQPTGSAAGMSLTTLQLEADVRAAARAESHDKH